MYGVRRSRRLSHLPPRELNDVDGTEFALVSSSSEGSAASSSDPHVLRPLPIDHIPRPPNPFMIFRSEFWAREKEKKAGERDHCQISCKAAEEWNKLSAEDRIPYRELAELAKQRHAELYPTYKYSPAPRKEAPVRPPAAKRRPSNARPKSRKVKSRRGITSRPDENADADDYDDDDSYRPSSRRSAPYHYQHAQSRRTTSKLRTVTSDNNAPHHAVVTEQAGVDPVVEAVHENIKPQQHSSAAGVQSVVPSLVASKSCLSLQSHEVGEIPAVDPSPGSDSSSSPLTHAWDIDLSTHKVELVESDNFLYDLSVEYGLLSENVPDEMEQLLEYYS